MSAAPPPRLAALPEPICVYNFPRWKHSVIRQCFPGKRLAFIREGDTPSSGGSLVLWGMAPVPAGIDPAMPVVRVEDGFLRSVGLGADLVRPVSWTLDRQGIYYNTAAPSDLETILRETDFTPELLARAAALRRAIVAAGITKYNTGTAAWQRPPTGKTVILVPGQVESDASIRHGAGDIRTNLGLLRAVTRDNPDAYLIYKPHPDVVARLRLAGQGEDDAAYVCDEIVTAAPMDKLVAQVDAVHVLTSLAGFEALLRDKPVTCWGTPFYAGWGLTDDRGGRDRGISLSLDALVAGTLLLYPLYLSRDGQSLITAEEALETLVAWRARQGLRPPWWQGAYRILLRRFAGVR